MNGLRFEETRETVVLTMRQRCFWLFAALLLLLVWVPFLEGSASGRVALNVSTLLVLITGTAALGRGTGAVLITVLLALPTALFLFLGLDGHREYLILSQAFGAAFFFSITSYLLGYTLRRDVMTMDKLYGAAAAFLLLGILWSYLYVILLAFYPGALHLNGAPLTSTSPSTILYFSFVTLTATGMSDIMPVHPVARMLCMLEMITGILFIAVLIARLAGTYPPREPGCAAARSSSTSAACSPPTSGSRCSTTWPRVTVLAGTGFVKLEDCSGKPSPMSPRRRPTPGATWSGATGSSSC